MKNFLIRLSLFSLIAVMSFFLMGASNLKTTSIHQNSRSQLQQIASNFRNIPLANRHNWEIAVSQNPELLIRLSSIKFETVVNNAELAYYLPQVSPLYSNFELKR